MRIHYYMQYFPGRDAPGSRQPYSLARFLAERGHEITVVAGNSNLDTGAREESTDTETKAAGRLRVLRLPSLPGGRGTNVARLSAYSAFMLMAGLRGAVLPRPDVILGSIQPLFTGLAAWAAARIRQVPFVLEVRDLWPDALLVKKALSPAQARPLFALTNHLYRSAERIVSITPGIRRELLKKQIPGGKIDVFPNGFDPALFAGSESKREEIRKEYGWGDDTVAMYTGSFTKVTAVDVLVRAAARLNGSARIRFEFFGAGPTRKAVEHLACELRAINVAFHDPVPKVQVPGLLAAADLGLMSLFDTPLAHIYFENKFLDYMGAGKPIIAAFEGEQADIIRRKNAGLVAGPGDDLELSRLLLQASSDPEGRKAMGQEGRRLVRECLQLPDILNRYATMLEAAAVGRLAALPAWEPAA